MSKPIVCGTWLRLLDLDFHLDLGLEFKNSRTKTARLHASPQTRETGRHRDRTPRAHRSTVQRHESKERNSFIFSIEIAEPDSTSTSA